MSGLFTHGADSLLHSVSLLLVRQILVHLKQKKGTLFTEIRKYEEEVFVIFRPRICQNPANNVPTEYAALVNTFEAERGSNWIEKIPFLSLKRPVNKVCVEVFRSKPTMPTQDSMRFALSALNVHSYSLVTGKKCSTSNQIKPTQAAKRLGSLGKASSFQCNIMIHPYFPVRTSGVH